jgi:hypothetical protein
VGFWAPLESAKVIARLANTGTRSQIMSHYNLIEIARQADAILGDQGDGFEGFETQMRRALARSYQVDADAIEVLVEDIDAAMYVCGHELICSRDDAGNLHYTIGQVITHA